MISTRSPSAPPAANSCASAGRSAVTRAARLLERALQDRSAGEWNEGARLAGMMEDPAGKAFTLAMVDEVFRSGNRFLQARRWRRLIREFGMPKFLGPLDRMLLRVGSLASTIAPQLVMPLVARRLRVDSARVILDAEPSRLNHYLDERRGQGFRINLNQLGEAVLGEEEAARRLRAVLALLANPRVDYVSVKISAIFSQINLVAWKQTLFEIKIRLRQLYRAALPTGKFVNLDMEEYRDLALTLSAFQEVLNEPEFRSLSGGIVLQAYLPDSWEAQQKLTAWARRRVAEGGAGIKLRLVKGANLAMEAVEAELHGWQSAPYTTKADTDANFRRMLEFGCQPENAAAVRLGVASHNLFDAALALELRERLGTSDRVEIEMLEGMANHQARAVHESAKNVLLYAPVVQREDFPGAMAYLVRRLDENTAPQNFLRVSFDLRPGSTEWLREQDRFERGWELRTAVSSVSRRLVPAIDAGKSSHFENEPDSDWTQPATRARLELALASKGGVPIPPLPELESVLNLAQSAQPQWEQLGVAGRARILREAANIMAAQRCQSIASLQDEGKKAVPEADAEVSEAIDFARYYAGTAEVPERLSSAALGTVVIAPPWNFPYAIPCGGVVAALMAGNSVILKPAPETVQIAWLLAQQLWLAGVPREVLQFFPCADGETGRALLADLRVAAVVLTGAWETARLFQQWRPSLRLFAETSGKNAIVITAQADRELAVKDLVRSAFGHSGQKCSAASLAIVEAEVYEDPVFRRQLRDAAASLPVGPSEDPRSVVTPLIRPPGEALARASTSLEPGEDWLLAPRQVGDDPCLWSPGIRVGVSAGSWFHRTECFGPVLGVMCAASLEDAVRLQNSTDYGLTAGLHSLDPAEQAWWRDHVQAGNLYINRPITGAIVQRQPFGGWKRSSIGPGAKAGGPNYVYSFLRLSDTGDVPLNEVERDYSSAWSLYFGIDHDPSGLRCEENILRYRPSRGVILRLPGPDETTVRRAQVATRVTGTPLTISLGSEESAEDFLARLPGLARTAETLRTVGVPSEAILRAAHECHLNWIDAPVTASGRAELRFWLREQAISHTLHRYGQIADWQRQPGH